MNEKKKIIVIGGGAAGFFGAINAAAFHPDAEILILEKGTQLLGKVKVSGGGRCNVTHACFNPNELVRFYPRGEKELLGPFHQFMTGDTVEWFSERGVELKTESDNRMFPQSNSSQTIIDCFLSEARKSGIQIRTQCGIHSLSRENGHWVVTTENDTITADKILLTTGSSMQVWELLRKLGHAIIDPVPSLFTFKCKDPRIAALPGISVPHAIVRIVGSTIETEGPLLITHWGFSGPAILRSSAWGANWLAEKNYSCTFVISWNGQTQKETLAELRALRDNEGKKICSASPLYEIPQRLWKTICDYCSITDIKWASLSNKQIEFLAKEISAAEFQLEGKSTFKDEFVTAGGIDLAEVNMKTMESKLFPGLFFAGEILNIDAITGGFNFQAAWTTSFIAAKNL